MRARVIRVRVDRREATVATDAAIGDTVVYVKDAGDLTAPGTVQANDDAGTLLDYTAVTMVEDDDPTDLDSPDSITLAEPLAVAIDAKTTLYVYEAPTDPDDPDDPRVAEVIALCIPEDDEDAAETGEPVRAIVPREHQDDLPAGARPDPGVPVVLEWDDDVEVWTVARIRGKGSRAIRFEHAEPAYTPTSDELTAGTFTRQLLHRNIAAEHGLFTQINGVTLGSEWWSLDAEAGQVTVTIPPWVAVAPAERREFGWPMYAYRRGIAVDPPEEPGAVPFSKRTGTWRNSGGDTIAGLAAGDLVVLAAYNTTAGTSDSRFTTAWSGTAMLEWGGTGPVVVQVASIDSDVSDVALTLVSSGAWYVLTPEAGRSLTHDGRVGEQPTIMACGSGEIPALSGTGSGALGFSFQRGPIGGAYGDNVWPAGWSNDGDVGSYEVVAFASTSMGVVGAVPSPHTDTSDSWVGCTIGLGLG